MLFTKKTLRSRVKKAFTLIEILTVVAIIGLVAVIIVGLQPGNPHGLDDALRIASMEFKIARVNALSNANPDRDPEANPRYNIRTAVLVLNDEDDEERHLRLLVPIIGGTDDESKTDISDYYWYAVGGTTGTLLPAGTFFVPPSETSLTAKSVIEPIDGNREVTLDPSIQEGGKKFGTGSKKWFAYFFDSNGQTYMSKAVFMIAEGIWMPGNGVKFDDDAPAVGFAITRNGAIIYTKDSDEAEAAMDL